MQRHTAPDFNSSPSTRAWADSMPRIIETSHRRSRAYGLQPESPADFNPLTPGDLSLPSR